MQLKNQAPDCAIWNIWEGPEIEGYTDLDVRTLFIRFASLQGIIDCVHTRDFKRVWLCDEFIFSEQDLAYLQVSCNKVDFIIGCTYNKYLTLSKFVKDNFQLYIQLNDLNLKKGDHIKVGNLFFEESFMMGQGKRSKPDLYKQDIKIS